MALRLAAEILARRRAQEGLLAFCEYTHPSWQTSAHHVKIAHRLEQVERLDVCECCGKVIDRLATFAPPRHGKTELVSRRFPAWCFGRHQEWQMICAQATGQLALDTGADVREIVKSPEYKRIFPSVTLREDAQAAGRWLTNKGGVYFAAGVDGTIVGRGANILNIDDPHGGRQAADSQRMRDIAGNWYFGDALTRLMPPSRQLLTLTRWHEDDLAGRLLPKPSLWASTPDPTWFCCGNGWHVLLMVAITNEGTDREEALWPERYPLELLLERKAAMVGAGRGREWRSQYQQRPVAEEGGYLQRAWFATRYDTRPPDLSVFLITDFAVTEKTGEKDPDRTEIGAIGLGQDDKVYVLDWATLVSTSDVWIEKLIDMVAYWEPMAVFGEKGVIKNAIEPALLRRMEERRTYARLEWMPTTGDKLARGRSLQAWAASKRVIFPAQSLWHENMIDELVAVGGGGRYWDKFDAMAHFFLAIDSNHPATVCGVTEPVRPRDRWAIIDGGCSTWKVA